MQLRQAQARLLLMSKLHNRMIVAEQATISDSDVGAFHVRVQFHLFGEGRNHSTARQEGVMSPLSVCKRDSLL